MGTIGIDLGTTNTVVAAVRDGRASTIEDEEGSRLIPSIVAFHPNGSVLVGRTAKERRYMDPTSTIYSVKRLIGRPWSSTEVQESRTRFPFDLLEGPKDSTMVVARGEQYALPEISAFVLRRAKQIAEARLGETVDKAVITVPANFNDLQRAATKVAGKLAGLEVMRILNEPTAAALAYGQQIAQSERIAIFDLGGGTFDITLLDLSGQVFEVLATGGDTSLGGDDIDVLIADRMSAQFREIHRFDPRAYPESFGKLRLLAEKLKIDLSTEQEVWMNLPEIGFGEGGAPLSIRFRMNRTEIEHMVRPLIEKTIEVTRFAIDTIGQRKEAFDRVILVGGATRMPVVARAVEAYFCKPPFVRVNPDEVVALGAAIQAYSLTKGARSNRPKMPSLAESTPSGVTQPTLQHARPAPSMPPELPKRGKPLVTEAHAKDDSFETFAQLPRGLKPASKQGDIPTPAVAFHLEEPPGAARPVAGGQPPPLPVRAKQKSVVPPPPAAIIALGEQASRSFTAPMSATSPREVSSEIVAEAPLQPPLSPPPTPDDGGMPAPDPHAVRPDWQPQLLQDGIIAHTQPLLIDVTPLSLSVETVGGYCDVLIPANSPVPCDRTRIFLTAADQQTMVCVNVAQGESRRFHENTFLGQCELTDLPARARGEVRIAVTFEIDADGILNVSATDTDSGRATQARLRLLGAATEEGVNAMLARQAARSVH
jgi:molecular chaperone DnaK